MIISASRRTDIPAFYSDWLMQRVQAGWVAVPNPMNRNQISMISLAPADVDVIVFWTRDPRPLFGHLHHLDSMGYRFYFQHTITGYPRLLEPRTPLLRDAVDSLQRLSQMVGPNRVIWRYDPILFSGPIDEEYHLRRFSEICSKLAGHSSRCVISFVDFYRKARTNLARLPERVTDLPPNHDLLGFAKRMSQIGASYGFPGRCIDGDLIRDLFGLQVDQTKDPGQREACGCIVSKDIGMYDSCLHGCMYCYANLSLQSSIEKRKTSHNPLSASLLGWVDPEKGPRAQLNRQFGLL
jgi:hypothetical protein